MAKKGGGGAGKDGDSTAQAVPEWTEEQRGVIAAPAGARLLVSAGPGTGKTAVACARVSGLVSVAGLDPNQVWLVSFTQTAVHELRQRIAAYAGGAGRIAGLRIATIDSHAWSIQSGFNAEAALTGSYEENIAAVIELIKAHEGVFEYLSGVRHLLVDEAQDVVGIRCLLMLELINALPEECGVTVLADDAQAIYGFAEDDVATDFEGTLPEKIREHLDFEDRQLREIHRTDDLTLLRLYRQARGIVLKGTARGRAGLDEIRRFLAESNHGKLPAYSKVVETLPADLDNAFFLFRRRGEALQASSYLALRPHRLRMSGLPRCIHPWIAMVLWDWVEPQIDRAEFAKRWKARLNHPQRLYVDGAWRILVRICGVSENRVDVRKLSARLASKSPPVDLSEPDFGFAGPVVGTIHGSKGREAGEVYLYLPPVGASIEGDEAAEEARVLFVAASRAKSKLRIGQDPIFQSRKVRSGRAFSVYPFGKHPARACVEIGRSDDIDAVGLVGRSLYHDAKIAERAQTGVARLTGRMGGAAAQLGPKSVDYRYELSLNDERLCFLQRNIGNDMFEIAKEVDGIVRKGCTNPPRELRYLRNFGTRTITVSPDDSVREALHSPWRESGFMIAPMVLGYGMVYFRWPRSYAM